jgi:hypothetical protein
LIFERHSRKSPFLLCVSAFALRASAQQVAGAGAAHGLLPNLTDIRGHTLLVRAVDVQSFGEIVEITRPHLEPGALHGTAEAEQW